jgi:hypothetical protein
MVTSKERILAILKYKGGINMWSTNTTERMSNKSFVGVNGRTMTVAGTKREAQVEKQTANTQRNFNQRYSNGGVRLGYQDIVSLSEMPKEGRVLVRGRITGSASAGKKTWRNAAQEPASNEDIANEEVRRAEEKRREQEQQKRIITQKEMFRQMIQKQREAAKNGEERADDMAKIMEIARRIADGDTVPQSDEKKLMEYSADLYQVAKASAMANRDKEHNKYDALFDDEEDTPQKMLDENNQETPFGAMTDQGETAVSAENVEMAGMVL